MSAAASGPLVGSQVAAEVVVRDLLRVGLSPGARVVFTQSDFDRRDIWRERCRDRGLVPAAGISNAVSLVVCTDPSLATRKLVAAARRQLRVMTYVELREAWSLPVPPSQPVLPLRWTGAAS